MACFLLDSSHNLNTCDLHSGGFPLKAASSELVRQLTPRRQSVCNLSFVSAFKGPHTVINALYTFSPRGYLTLLCPWSLLKRSGLLPSHLSGLSRLLRRTCSTSRLIIFISRVQERRSIVPTRPSCQRVANQTGPHPCQHGDWL